MPALPPILQFVLFLVGMTVLVQAPFVLLSFLAFRWETRRKSMYVPVDESEAPPTNGYLDCANAEAERYGFEYLGPCRSGNEKLYKMRYDLWVSADRQVFAVFGAGRVTVIPQRATWLTTRLVDGRVLITLDEPGASPTDLSGMTDWALVAKADFHELLSRHASRIEAEETPVEPYSERDPFGDYIALIGRRAERMVAAGQGYYLDDRRDTWRLNTRGALRALAQSYRRIFVQIVRNYGRRTLARPGDPGYVPSDRGRTRYGLRYVELGCWVAILAVARLSAEGLATPEQARSQVLVLLAAVLGLVAIWGARWWLTRETVDPRIRRRTLVARAAILGLLGVGYFLIRAEREPWDTVERCDLLVGGGRAYVVVEGVHSEVLTSRLARMLERPGRPPFRKVVHAERRLEIIETDGSSTRIGPVPRVDWNEQIRPVGRDLYLIALGDGVGVARWRDGRMARLPDEGGKKIGAGLAESLEAQCDSQGWEYAGLEGFRNCKVSRTVRVGGRDVGVDLAMEVIGAVQFRDGDRTIRVTLKVPGSAPVTWTFPAHRAERP